jgi:hypothetical protein
VERVLRNVLTAIREEVITIQRETVDEGDLARALAVFDPVWESLSPREQSRIVRLLVERVGYDGRDGRVTVTFRSPGVKALCSEAVVRGRLFETSSGIPVLEVPEEDILAVGTTNPLADVATQAHVTARVSNPEPTRDRLPKKGTGAPWDSVYGELLTFDDPESRLPAIDRLEGFHPGAPCLYRRVLTSAQVHGIVLPAWLYVGEDLSGRLTPLGGSRWPRKP